MNDSDISQTKLDDARYMRRAIELASRGEGMVEPNPMVGCVIVRDGKIIGEGFHRFFGGPHAEVEALQSVGTELENATLYVTLEPCCHLGKTPPCTEAILQSGIQKVVVAMRDPFPQVNGGGIATLEKAGIAVTIGCLEKEALELNAPYLMRMENKRPWILAKWAMTLDGKMATQTGSSRWISSEVSRKIVHQLRARMDAIMVGGNTVRNDDPLLTARPPGIRTPIRIVLDTQGTLSPNSRLAQTARDSLVLVVTGPNPDQINTEKLRDAGCEVLTLEEKSYPECFGHLFHNLADRGVTNLLVEGGGTLLGSLFDERLIDECHVFIAPKLIGGCKAIVPFGGKGIAMMDDAVSLENPKISQAGSDIYLCGHVCRQKTQ